ncbi:MAG: TlyA family RNA methyltransferase [Dermatophilaceae bacterium]
MRLDAMLVERGLARSRGDARDLVRDGAVRLNGAPARKPSAAVAAGDDVSVAARASWVGRGARKLDAAFAAFGAERIDPLSARGLRCLDVGASTGGFTQVLLERGAAHVVALDVGRGQLVDELARDPRVTNAEGVTVRDVEPAALGGPFDLVVADLSFISLRLVAADLSRLTSVRGQGVWLVKPQFEVGRRAVGKRGLVTDPVERREALRGALDAARHVGLTPRSVVPSPVTGATGNREYLLWVCRRPDLALPDADAATENAAIPMTKGER